LTICDPTSRARKLNEFLNRLNSIYYNIQFTMDTESDSHSSFLNIDICRKPDCSVSHTVYRKVTHTNLTLKPMPRHHPSNKHSVLFALVLRRPRAIHDQDILRGELDSRRNKFKQNSYNPPERREKILRR
jgi:hypothetical protein